MLAGVLESCCFLGTKETRKKSAHRQLGKINELEMKSSGVLDDSHWKKKTTNHRQKKAKCTKNAKGKIDSKIN